MSNEADLDLQIEQAFRDVLRTAIAWRIATDQADLPDLVDFASRKLHTAVVEYESALSAWEPAEGDRDQHE